jgi:hypothetical protein
VIAISGCSYFYGENLIEPDSLHVALEQALGQQHGVSAEVFNFARPGASAGTQGAMLAYAANRLPIRLTVAVVMSHHMGSRNDCQAAWEERDPSFLYRLMIATGVAPVAIAIRNAVARLKGAELHPSQALDALLKSAGGLPLLVITDLADQKGSTSPAKRQPVDAMIEEARAWFEAHPEVAWRDVSLDPEWRSAETEMGHYWSPNGVQQVSRILASAIVDVLTRDLATSALPPAAAPPRNDATAR